MKSKRLDEILIQLGYVNEDQIKQALMRQKAHGGRLGFHLLYFKFLSEEQLAAALAEQYQVPAFWYEDHTIDEEDLDYLPVEMAEDFEILPLKFNRETRLLTLAVADPENLSALGKVKRAYRARKLELFVAPETQIKRLITQLYRGNDEFEYQHIVELPDLFGGGESSALDSSLGPDPEPAGASTGGVLMISKAAFLRNYLVPIFEREGLHLQVLSDRQDIDRALQSESFDQVLVARDMAEQFSAWLKSKEIMTPQAEVQVFSSVSGALADNPVSYKRIFHSLLEALQINAELRCPAGSWLPAYTAIDEDIRKLGRLYGLRRVTIDGLLIAASLLLPAGRPGTAAAEQSRRTDYLNIAAIDSTIIYARTLQFPSNIPTVLEKLKAIHTTALDPVQLEDGRTDLPLLAAEILALVWYRFCVLGDGPGSMGSPDEPSPTIRSALREQAGRLASLEMVETYLRLIEDAGNEASSSNHEQIFFLGRSPVIAGRFSDRFNRLGYASVVVQDPTEARRMCERSAPTAILIDADSFPDDIVNTGRLLKLSSEAKLFALIQESDPSHTLDLLDAGFDDVFSAPHDFNVITARINKYLRSSPATSEIGKRGGFSATFEAFSFIDLLQALGQSQKTVRIDITGRSNQKAEIYLEKGKLVYAGCNQLKGAEVIYEIIRWRDDGSFIVDPAETIPPANIFEPTEALLMEGCRLLDESRI